MPGFKVAKLVEVAPGGSPQECCGPVRVSASTIGATSDDESSRDSDVAMEIMEDYMRGATCYQFGCPDCWYYCDLEICRHSQLVGPAG